MKPNNNKSPSIKILLVDDEEEVRSSLSTLLSKKGYAVDARDNAPEAVEALLNSSYDVLLTDLSMPEMNGIELLKQAGKIAPSMIKILMTGYGDVATHLEATKAGATGYLIKPISFSKIEAAIGRHNIKKNSQK